MSFMPAFYRRPARVLPSATPAGSTRRRDEDRRGEAGRRQQGDRAGEVPGEPDRPERELEAAEDEDGDVRRAENPRPSAHLPVEEPQGDDPDLGQHDEEREAEAADDVGARVRLGGPRPEEADHGEHRDGGRQEHVHGRHDRAARVHEGQIARSPRGGQSQAIGVPAAARARRRPDSVAPRTRIRSVFVACPASRPQSLVIFRFAAISSPATPASRYPAGSAADSQTRSARLPAATGNGRPRSVSTSPITRTTTASSASTDRSSSRTSAMKARYGSRWWASSRAASIARASNPSIHVRSQL